MNTPSIPALCDDVSPIAANFAVDLIKVLEQFTVITGRRSKAPGSQEGTAYVAACLDLARASIAPNEALPSQVPAFRKNNFVRPQSSRTRTP